MQRAAAPGGTEPLVIQKRGDCQGQSPHFRLAGGFTLDRPALQKVTEAVAAGRVDVVLVHNLARIGREWGMTQRYIYLLTRHKVKLLCIRDRLLFDETGAAPILTIKNAECPL